MSISTHKGVNLDSFIPSITFKGGGAQMRIAIMGAGSLGTIIGALITAGGQEIDLIDVNKEHVEALNHSGAKITGFMDLRVPVKALLPNEMTGKYDLVFLLTKQVYNQTCLDQL